MTSTNTWKLPDSGVFASISLPALCGVSILSLARDMVANFFLSKRQDIGSGSASLNSPWRFRFGFCVSLMPWCDVVCSFLLSLLSAAVGRFKTLCLGGR